MCGIVGVVQGEDGREPVPLAILFEQLDRARGTVPFPDVIAGLIGKIEECSRSMDTVRAMLAGTCGVVTLAQDRSAPSRVKEMCDAVWDEVHRIESALDRGEITVDQHELEELNEKLIRTKDLVWSIRNDALRVGAATLDLAGGGATNDALVAFAQMEIALSAIDRLEVRGRDSAGITVLIRGHDLDPSTVADLVAERDGDPLFRTLSVRVAGDRACFAYKAAAEIGELGDNTRAIRDAIRSDVLLHRMLNAGTPRALVLGHTRWASVGLISEANAHPLASDERAPASDAFIVAALNGDIDNHADLRVAEGLEFPLEVTTDAKIIPVLVSRRMREGMSLEDAFRATVASFEGSVAIAAASLDHPDRLLLALRGSGQALYVALGDGPFVIASEPYGFVEQASAYVRMDGEAQTDPEDPRTRGQIVVVREAGTHDISGIDRFAYDGTPVPVTDDDIRAADITTRDVDRGVHPHFLIKELSESPASFRRTLRGRLVERDGKLSVALGVETIPDAIRDGLREGAINRIVVIGQGTAAIAGRAIAGAIGRALHPLPIRVDAAAATELSGFGLSEDMSDTLLVVISQSGTTTDTNRTVEVARAKGAPAIAIVNRRHSDLTDRVDGVLYTSDGRDVEMAVPSTKAFYAQVAAGFLLASALSSDLDGATGVEEGVLRALKDLPDAMESVLESRPRIAEIARRHAPGKRDWAIVGNGANRIAAEEVRIKLSELCYKSISSDVTEDKKHIDLSAEPLILVCAAGLLGGNAEDVAKEVAIFRAHKASPIVICGEGEGSFDAALDVIRVPSVHPEVAFVLSAMAGHVFGYEAALAIDALATPMREARAVIEEISKDAGLLAGDGIRLMDRLRIEITPPATRFYETLRSGSYDGHMDPSTAVRVSSLLRYGTGLALLDAYQVEFGKIGTPAEVLTDLTDALSSGIDELTRPVDAIRHQAKTVTVGISRAEETLLQVPLVREVITAGVARDRLTYRILRELAALDPSIERVNGYTHYRIEGDVRGDALVQITDRGGIAHEIPSRTERDPRLRGTKHRVAQERDVLVARGGDGRTILFVPEVKGAEVTGIALLHITLHDRLPADVMRSVLQGYRDRYSALRDTVTETEPTFRDDLLAEINVTDLLIASIQALAERWRQA